jgi:arylsulfatase A-like enzyme
LDAAGIEQKQPMQGRSILPLLHGDRRDWQDEVFAQISESKIARAIRTHRWKYEVTADGSGWEQPGADRYTESHLYDLENDPYELDNLVGLPSVRELCDHLKERLIARMVEAGESAPVIEHTGMTGRTQHAILQREFTV